MTKTDTEIDRANAAERVEWRMERIEAQEALIADLRRQLAEARAALQQIIDLPGDAIDQAPGIAINALEQQKPCPC
jgi:outer membrane protein TolC